VRFRITNLILALTLVATIGGHWAFLQTVAWVGMTISYSQESCLSQAMAKTFDGKHPCKLCKFVSEGKKSEQKSEMKLQLKKVDYFTDSSTTFYFSRQIQISHSVQPLLSARSLAPPTPPPLFV
jgi:hypothetical protein